jgi:hypothetical protein
MQIGDLDGPGLDGCTSMACTSTAAAQLGRA